jgi:hypothetical protein
MMFLTKEEIFVLTGKVRKAQQMQVLDAAGIRYIENGIGELVVSRAHVERRLDGSDNNQSSESAPNFDALRKVS